MKHKYKPSLWWIAIAPLLLVLGVGSGTSIFLKQAFRTGQSESFTAPAVRRIDIREPGTYILSHNYKVAFQGKLYDEAPALPENTEISLKGPDGEIEMTGSTKPASKSKKRESMELGRYNIASPGKYTLSVSGLESPRVITFSQSVLTRIVLSTIASIVLNLIGWFGAPAIVIMVFSARLKDKRRFKAAHPELFEKEEPLRG